MSGRATSMPTRAERDAPAIIAHRTPTYVVGRNLVTWGLVLGCRLRVEGRAHLPPRGGALFVANHQSYLDIPIVAAAAGRHHVCFVARDTLGHSRFLGWIMRQSGCVLVQRGKPDRRALEEIVAHLSAGDWVAVYPEGTRSADGSVGEFRGGALLAARRAGVPIVPVGIRGAFEAWPRGQRLPRPRKIGVRFGAPLPTDGPRGAEALEDARAAICAMVGDGRYASVAPAP